MSKNHSKYTVGQSCNMCGESATHKVAEEMFDDYEEFPRHEFTAYVCCSCFGDIFGSLSRKYCRNDHSF